MSNLINLFFVNLVVGTVQLMTVEVEPVLLVLIHINHYCHKQFFFRTIHVVFGGRENANNNSCGIFLRLELIGWHPPCRGGPGIGDQMTCGIGGQDGVGLRQGGEALILVGCLYQVWCVHGVSPHHRYPRWCQNQQQPWHVRQQWWYPQQ